MIQKNPMVEIYLSIAWVNWKVRQELEGKHVKISYPTLADIKNLQSNENSSRLFEKCPKGN